MREPFPVESTSVCRDFRFVARPSSIVGQAVTPIRRLCHDALSDYRIGSRRHASGDRLLLLLLEAVPRPISAPLLFAVQYLLRYLLRFVARFHHLAGTSGGAGTGSPQLGFSDPRTLTRPFFLGRARPEIGWFQAPTTIARASAVTLQADAEQRLRARIPRFRRHDPSPRGKMLRIEP
jgi:hypothetical protein